MGCAIRALAVFVAGTVVGTAGLMLACLGGNYLVSVVGFGLVGGGVGELCSAHFLPRGSAKRGRFRRGTAATASAGYFGLFAGPPIIGSIAQLIGLQRALLLVALALILTLLLTRIGLDVRRP
jgi:hypothetical protein